MRRSDMSSEREIDPEEVVLVPDASTSRQALSAIESGEKGKGSLSSMWEVLLQMRVLLPYLARLVPLLDRGLVKAAPDLSEVHKGMHEIAGTGRDVSEQVQHQKLQLERIEEHVRRLRELADDGERERREISGQISSLRAWIRVLAVVSILSLATLAVVATMLLFYPGH